MKTLSQLIKANKFDYVNSDFEPNFKLEPIRGKVVIEKFNRNISTEDIHKELTKKGLIASNLTELLTWSKKEWKGRDIVVALGSVWSDHVPYVYGYGAHRELSLDNVADDWDAGYRFAATQVTKGKKSSDTGTLDITELGLLDRVTALENDMAKIKRFLII